MSKKGSTSCKRYSFRVRHQEQQHIRSIISVQLLLLFAYRSCRQPCLAATFHDHQKWRATCRDCMSADVYCRDCIQLTSNRRGRCKFPVASSRMMQGQPSGVPFHRCIGIVASHAQWLRMLQRFAGTSTTMMIMTSWRYHREATITRRPARGSNSVVDMGMRRSSPGGLARPLVTSDMEPINCRDRAPVFFGCGAHGILGGGSRNVLDLAQQRHDITRIVAHLGINVLVSRDFTVDGNVLQATVARHAPERSSL
jgi:hypothetical protein